MASRRGLHRQPGKRYDGCAIGDTLSPSVEHAGNVALDTEKIFEFFPAPFAFTKRKGRRLDIEVYIVRLIWGGGDWVVPGMRHDRCWEQVPP